VEVEDIPGDITVGMDNVRFEFGYYMSQSWIYARVGTAPLPKMPHANVLPFQLRFQAVRKGVEQGNDPHLEASWIQGRGEGDDDILRSRWLESCSNLEDADL
jgi:hypothetical protein